MKFSICTDETGIQLEVEGVTKEDTARTLAVAKICLEVVRQNCPKKVVRAAEKIEVAHARKEKKDKRKERRRNREDD